MRCALEQVLYIRTSGQRASAKANIFANMPGHHALEDIVFDFLNVVDYAVAELGAHQAGVLAHFLAQRDTVWHFDGVHSCINCAIGCATVAPRAVVKAFSGENIREIKQRSPFCDFGAFADHSGRRGPELAPLAVLTDAPDRGACSPMLSAQRAVLAPDFIRQRRWSNAP